MKLLYYFVFQLTFLGAPICKYGPGLLFQWIPGWGTNFSFATECRPVLRLTQATMAISLGVNARNVKMTPHPHLERRSRMREALPPFFLYTFVAWCSHTKGNVAFPHTHVAYIGQ